MLLKQVGGQRANTSLPGTPTSRRGSRGRDEPGVAPAPILFRRESSGNWKIGRPTSRACC